MYFLVGDEFGQIKLVQSKRNTYTLKDYEERSATASKSGFKKHRGTQEKKKNGPASHVIATLPSPSVGLNRDFSVSCLAWGVLPNVEKNDPCVSSQEHDLVMTSFSRSAFVVGRKNGFVEYYKFPACFNTTETCRRLFRISEEVVLCAPFGSLDYTSQDKNNRCVCMSKQGNCVIVDWDRWNTPATTEHLYNLIFDDVPEITFRKKKQGRLQRSDRSQRCIPTNQLSSPLPFNDIKVAHLSSNDSNKLPWIHSTFRVPSPLNCADLSNTVPYRVAFGGKQNLAKILDLEHQNCYFSAHNSKVSSLGLEDPIDVTAVSFLDCLNHGSSCLAVGNANGRLLIYDTRWNPKPVLDVQICDSFQSIVRIAAEPALRYQIIHQGNQRDLNEDCSNPTKNTESKPSLLWNCKNVSDLTCHKGQSNDQMLAISDNHGTVYLYDIRATGQVGCDSSLDSEFHYSREKKKHRNLYISQHYKPNTVISSNSSQCPIHFSANLRHHLPWEKGAITDFSWSAHNGESILLGVSLGRFAVLWDPNNRRSGKSPIYLKHKLTNCLMLDSLTNACKNSKLTPSLDSLTDSSTSDFSGSNTDFDDEDQSETLSHTSNDVSSCSLSDDDEQEEEVNDSSI